MNPDNITPPQPQVPAHHVSNSMKIVVLLLGLALIATLGYFTWIVGSEQEAAEEVAPSVKEKTEKTTSSQETEKTKDEVVVEEWKTYTNQAYGFQLNFSDLWKGYEVKSEKSAGRVISYYFNLPSPTTTQATTISSANFESIFAVGIYTVAEWSKIEGDGGPIGTKIATKDNYVFVYDSSQDWSPELQKAHDDIKNVIATFKAL